MKLFECSKQGNARDSTSISLAHTGILQDGVQQHRRVSITKFGCCAKMGVN